MIGFHIPVIQSSFYESIKYHYEGSGNIYHFQLFTKNPRQFKITRIKDEDANKCKNYIKENNIFLVTHASYLLNMSNPENWENKVENGKNEIENAFKIGAVGVVFHVGKHLKLSKTEGENLMYNYIQEMINFMKEKNINIKYIIETSAACGTELCSDIRELGAFYRRFTDEEKQYVGICIDTCHIFSAGYPIHNQKGCESFIQLVEEELNWDNVVCMHLNDSLSLKGCGCKLDRHANIMKGFIMDGMKTLIKFAVNRMIPHILETPYDDNKIFETHLDEIEQVHKWIE